VLARAGYLFRRGAGTVKSSDDDIAAITTTFIGLGEPVLMFLAIAQFLACFNYSCQRSSPLHLRTCSNGPPAPVVRSLLRPSVLA
jgi:hypothetical protein